MNYTPLVLSLVFLGIAVGCSIGVIYFTLHTQSCKNDPTVCGGTAPLCDTNKNKCVECLSDDDCIGSKLGDSCDTSTGQCKCGSGEGCSEGQVCSNGTCVQCANSSQCPIETPHCSNINQTCSSGCSDNMAFPCQPGYTCSSQDDTGKCVAASCGSDSDCAPGMKCSNGVCGGSSMYRFAADVTLDYNPSNILIQTAEDTPTDCANFCYAQEGAACTDFVWTNDKNCTALTFPKGAKKTFTPVSNAWYGTQSPNLLDPFTGGANFRGGQIIYPGQAFQFPENTTPDKTYTTPSDLTDCINDCQTSGVCNDDKLVYATMKYDEDSQTATCSCYKTTPSSLPKTSTNTTSMKINC